MGFEKRACWYRRYDDSKLLSDWRGGTFEQYSTDYMELEGGIGNYPVAIIEDSEEQRPLSVPLEFVSFAAIPPEHTVG